MNELRIFDNEEFGKVRIIEVEGKEWFCASDVAKALGYSNPRDAVSRHCRCVVKHDIPHPQNKEKNIEVSFIGEGDLYRLISHSHLPSAEKFEYWVFDEVLPSIRKHGAYLTPDVLEKTISDPNFMIGLLTNLKEEQDARKLAETKLEEAQPLISFAETVGNSNDAIDMGEMAKLCAKEGFKIGRNRLFELLRARKVLMRNNIPYQMYVDNGWFKVIETVKGDKIFMKTLVTGKGQIKIVELIKLNEENTI